MLLSINPHLESKSMDFLGRFFVGIFTGSGQEVALYETVKLMNHRLCIKSSLSFCFSCFDRSFYHKIFMFDGKKMPK